MTKGANFRRRQSAVDLIFAPLEAKEKENEKEEEDREEDYGKFIEKLIETSLTTYLENGQSVRN